jgi:outer membrane protein assembly factor BamB
LAEKDAVPLRHAPAVDSTGRIFLQMGGRLFALREEESKPQVLWEYVIGKHAPGPVVVGPEDSIFLHAADGCLHCIDGASGKQKRPPAYVGEPLGNAAPIVDREGNAWISAEEGGILKVNVRGRVQEPSPFFRSRQRFDSAGVLVGGILYILAEDGAIFAIATEGQQGVSLWNHVGDRGFAGWRTGAAPAVTDDGLLVVAGHDECLLGFSADGDPLWKTQMPGQTLGAPTIDRHGQIYAGVGQFPRGRKSRGSLVCLDGNSHKIRWERAAAGAVESTPAIGNDDVIYFGDNAGVIHTVDLLGNVLWTAQVGSPVRSAGTSWAPGRVAFGLDDQTLVVLQCSSTGLATSGWPKFAGTLGQSGCR